MEAPALKIQDCQHEVGRVDVKLMAGTCRHCQALILGEELVSALMAENSALRGEVARVHRVFFEQAALRVENK